MNEPARHRPTTEVLSDTMAANPGDCISLDALLQPLRNRAFGVLLLLLAIPNFLPVPIGIGGIMGVLVAGLGLEMLCGLEQPLVPRWLRRKTIRHATLERFLKRSTRLLGWLERLCRPRLERLTQRPWSLLSGLVLVLLGTLLALPIPFTNYLFGGVLLAFAFALLERDGALLLLLWIGSAVLVGTSVAYSGEIGNALVELVHRVF